MTSWVLSPIAEAELVEALDYILGEGGSLETATKVLSSFENAFALLAETPRMGHLRPELTGERIRWWRVYRYLVLYDPETKPIRVLRIVGGAQDLEQMFQNTH